MSNLNAPIIGVDYEHDAEVNYISNTILNLNEFRGRLEAHGLVDSRTESYMEEITGFLTDYNANLKVGYVMDANCIRKSQRAISEYLIRLKAYLYVDLHANSPSEIEGGISDSLLSEENNTKFFDDLSGMKSVDNDDHDHLFECLETMIGKQIRHSAQSLRKGLDGSFSRMIQNNIETVDAVFKLSDLNKENTSSSLSLLKKNVEEAGRLAVYNQKNIREVMSSLRDIERNKDQMMVMVIRDE